MTKAVVFLLLAAGFTGGTFFLEHTFGKIVDEEEEKNFLPERSVVRFYEDEDEDRKDVDIDLEVHESDGYVFGFDEGRFWGNFSVVPSNVNILVENVAVIPNRAVFDLSYDDGQFELAVYGGDVYLGFLDEDVEVTRPTDSFSDIFMNQILVPRDAQVRFNIRQITPDIKPLLYSKLAKELRLSSIPEAKRESDWVRDNVRKDMRFLEGLRQDYLFGVVQRGLSVRGKFWADFVFWARENLTFVPERKENIFFKHLFDHLDSAIFHAVDGDRTEVDKSLESFNSYRLTLPTELRDGEEYYERLDEYLNDLLMFGPRDPLYYVWRKLVDKKFVEGRDRYEILNSYWLDVYRAMEVGEEEAISAFERYYSYFEKFSATQMEDDFRLKFLSYQNQLLDSLLLRTSVFYKDYYFEIKSLFEHSLLELYPEGRLRDELKQLFVSNKIDLMRRLRVFFFDERISADEAEKIFGRLISEARDFMPPEDTGVAVIRLFQSQLEGVVDFWGYLQSPHYHVGAFGADHRERYEFYLSERELIKGVDDLVREVLWEPVEVKTLEEMKSEVRNLLLQHFDIYSVEISDMQTPDQRNVGVRGVIAGYPFEAVYDRYQDSLREVYVYGELVSERAVKVEGLAELILSEFAELVEEIEPDVDVTIETVAQRIARKNITETLEGYGFVLEMDDVSVVDRYNLVYRVENVVLEGYEGIKVTFDLVISGDELVRNLFFSVYDTPRVFDENYSIEDVVSMVEIEEDLYRSPPPVPEDPEEEDEEEDRILR